MMFPALSKQNSGLNLDQLGKALCRRSVYWVDYVPPRPGPGGHTEIIATARVQELARHRDPHYMWKGDRPTPMWPVRDEAQRAEATARILTLSRHKTIHLDHKMERSPYMIVSEGAQTAQPSQRLEQLAVPKQRIDRHGAYETEWGQRAPVSLPAMTATASERVDQLAQSKDYHKMFKDERPVQWEVPKPALNALASLRMQQLARPRSRTMIKDDYDPYKVSSSARRARCTPRVEELCVPLPRKVRQKKVA